MSGSAIKNKSKTSNLALKDFSPISFAVKPIIWSDSENDEINNLESLFSFKDGFDLHAHLANMAIEITTFIEIDRQRPTEKETENFFKQAKETTSELIASLQEEKFLLALLPAKIKISELNHLFEIMGAHHIGLLCESAHGPATIHEIKKAMAFLCDDDFLSSFLINLHELLGRIESIQTTLPPPKPGRKEVKLEIGITHKLLCIYTEGTGLKAKCNWHPMHEQHTGEFYQFLLKAIDLIKKHMPIKVLDNKTWGYHAKKAIKYHYRKKTPEE